MKFNEDIVNLHIKGKLSKGDIDFTFQTHTFDGRLLIETFIEFLNDKLEHIKEGQLNVTEEATKWTRSKLK